VGAADAGRQGVSRVVNKNFLARIDICLLVSQLIIKTYLEPVSKLIDAVTVLQKHSNCTRY
jgi:hypothetical protein